MKANYTPELNITCTSTGLVFNVQNVTFQIDSVFPYDVVPVNFSQPGDCKFTPLFRMDPSSPACLGDASQDWLYYLSREPRTLRFNALTNPNCNVPLLSAFSYT